MGLWALFSGLFWVWNQAESHISSGLVLWPVRLLLFFLGMLRSVQLWKLIGEAAVKGFAKAWEAIMELQDSVLERFDRFNPDDERVDSPSHSIGTHADVLRCLHKHASDSVRQRQAAK